MNKEKAMAMLDIAYDLIAQVHSYICKNSLRGECIVDSSLDATHQLIHLQSHIENWTPVKEREVYNENT